MYVALELIPPDKDVTIAWLCVAQPEKSDETVNRLLEFGLIEVEEDRVRITHAGEMYRDIVRNVSGLEKRGVTTPVHIKQEAREKVDPKQLRRELFDEARKYHKIRKRDWEQLGIRQQWNKIRVFLVDPQIDRDRYFSVLTPRTKKLLRDRKLIK
jgi:hypothetical protein